MAEELFNRHSVALAGVCASVTDYMIFAWEERRLFEAPRLPLRPKNSVHRSSPRPDRFPKLRLGNPSWDSSRCALQFSRMEDWRPDPLTASFCSRNDSHLEARKRSLTPFEPAKPKTVEDFPTQKDRRHPRSVSVEPSCKQSLCVPRKGRAELKLTIAPITAVAPKGLTGKAVPLIGRQLKNGFSTSYNRGVLHATFDNAGKMTETVTDSPIKRRYKRLLQRTSKAMESENFAGWE